MQTPEPTAEHKWLMQLVGNWEFDCECVMGEGQPPMKSSGTQSTRALGSLWILGEMQSKNPNGPSDISIITLGYDPAKNCFVGTFVATCMTHLWPYEGQLDSAKNTLKLNSTGPSFAGDGSTTSYQDIFEMVDKDTYTLSSRFQNQDGSWTDFMSGTYKRV